MLTFTCPICGNGHIVEHWADIYKDVLIASLTEDQPLYHDAYLDDSQERFVGYFCATCSYQLVDELGREIKTYPELLHFVRNSFALPNLQKLTVGCTHMTEV
jgi:hypothetical protein